jgi:hypothetical protein
VGELDGCDEGRLDGSDVGELVGSTEGFDDGFDVGDAWDIDENEANDTASTRD